MYDYRFHTKAQVEYEDAVSWYQIRSVKVAKNFIKQVEDTLERICKNPYQFNNEFKNFYCVGLRKYPFTIVYKINMKDNIIEIYAIFHQKRNPNTKYNIL